LVLATIAAFAWAQRLKRDPLVLDRVKLSRTFTPKGDCRSDRARIHFRVTRSDRADVQVIRPGGRLIVTLARDRYLKRYHFFNFRWNGRSRYAAVAPPGRYKLRVKLLGQDRVLVPPGVMRLHVAPPHATSGCGRRPGAAP
jgi:hypothetical protein